MQLRLRARFGRLRRRDKVLGMLGVTIACVSIALYAISQRWELGLNDDGRVFTVSRGVVHMAWPMEEYEYTPLVSIGRCSSNFRIGMPSFTEIPSSRSSSGFWIVVLPLWMPFLLGLGLAAPVLLHMRRMRFGNVCPACDYDRTGLPDDAVCPECGKER